MLVPRTPWTLRFPLHDPLRLYRCPIYKLTRTFKLYWIMTENRNLGLVLVWEIDFPVFWNECIS